MFKTTTKTIKSLPKTKYKRRGEEKWRAERKNETNGGRGVLYSNFSDGFTDGTFIIVGGIKFRR
jgi:hypothetical protein